MSPRRTGTYWRLTEVASEWLCAWICGHTLPYVTFPKPNKRGNVQCTHNVTLRRVRVTIVVVVKAVRITESEYASVALVLQHAKRMRRIIYSSVACLVLPFFLRYLINDTIFWKMSLNIKCVLIFSTAFVWNIPHSKTNSARHYHECT